MEHYTRTQLEEITKTSKAYADLYMAAFDIIKDEGKVPPTHMCARADDLIMVIATFRNIVSRELQTVLEPTIPYTGLDKLIERYRGMSRYKLLEDGSISEQSQGQKERKWIFNPLTNQMDIA